MTNQLTIGSTVSYLKADAKTAEIEKGNGTLIAIFLNPDKRMMAQVDTGELDPSGSHVVINVDYGTLNCNDKYERAYKKLIPAVKAVSEEGNALVAVTVDEYNDKVQALYTATLGAPLVFGE